MKMLNGVKRWLDTFLVPTNEDYGNIPKDRYELRYELMKEENEEYLQACKDDNHVEILDALTDKMFVLLGTYLEHGVSETLLKESFKEVLNSNFSKLENGKPIFRSDGKIMKGKGYFKPNLKKFIDGNVQDKEC